MQSNVWIGLPPSLERGTKREGYHAERFDRKTVKRCACGFRIRGENHEHGPHHKKQNLRK